MSHAAQVAPFGSWKSPITAELLAEQSITLADVATDGEDVYWLEARPAEQGRHVIVRRTGAGVISDVLPASTDVARPAYSARSLVYAYGGGSFTVAEGLVVFVNHAQQGAHPDQRLYRVNPGRTPVPMTPDTGGRHRYGNLVMDRERRRVLCVREDWRNLVEGQPRMALVAADVDGQRQQVLAQGRDFYASPTLSPDGKRLAWLEWDAPRMPWDGCELWVAEVGVDGTLRHARLVAGSSTESIFQPQWSPQGELYFISDRNNWWNLFRLQGRSVVPVMEHTAEFGVAQWQLGLSTYAFESARRIVCAYNELGEWKLGQLDVVLGVFTQISLEDYTDISQVRAEPGAAYFIGGGPQQPASVVRLDMKTDTAEVLRASGTVTEELRPYLSQPEPLTFSTSEGETAHAFFYPPTNPAFRAAGGEKPPLLIHSHGGPTYASTTLLDWHLQYFTSRGFAVVDVNYRGSTGWGREYRLALYGNWGVADVDDGANAARHLVLEGKVDAKRMAARGSSAGAFTSLSLLAFRDILRCGVSYSGVSNLQTLAAQTSNFEAHYLEQLLGPMPEAEPLLRDRSPYFHAEQVHSPVIFFQGNEDPVVPPSQTEEMVTKLRGHGVPVAALYFEGEQHGLRMAAHIRAALEGELAFYAQVMGFAPADTLPAVELQPPPVRH